MILEVSTAWLLSFLLVLARMSALLVFVPIPGSRQLLGPAKATLALSLAVLLTPLAHTRIDVSILSSAVTVWRLSGLLLAEAAFGVAVGAAVGLLLEVFGVAAQVLGFQAGYSYVNMIDPNTQVDASILNVLLALLGSLLFFAFDLHLHLLRALVVSIENWPLGAFALDRGDVPPVIALGGAMLEAALRMSFPVVAVLLLIDLTLALLNQVNARLQLTTLAFPAKIVGAIALLIPVLPLTPRLFLDLAEDAQRVILALAGG